MKKFARPLLVAALSCTTPAFAAVYTDSSMNYPDGWITGANGGEGFAAWILTSTPGNGWSGSGIWSGADAELTGNVLDLNKNAFGFVAKGENSSFTASRNFRAALDPDDSFEFDMAVNWDCGDNPDSRKGIVLLAGDTEILTINHDSFPGPISINGQHHDNPALTNYGTSTMHWTIRATSPTELAVTTTARDGLSPPFTTNLPVPSSALSGFRLQSIGQVNDTTENHAKRQTYFNHFTLTIARPLPELYSLTLTENNGTWAITNAAPTPLSFTLTRSSADDEAHVSLASSDPAFVSLPNPSLTFPPGTASATFTATAKIYTNGNVSSISASALGYNSPNPWDLKGPAYLISANSTTYPDAPWQINQDDTSSLSLHNSQAHWFPGDDTLVTLSPEDNAILSVASLDPWTPVENGTLATATISGLAAGSSLVNVYYDLVKIGDYRFTVIEPPNPIAISGPHSLRIGTTGLYQIITTDIEGESLLVTLSNPSIATASPETLTPYTPSETNAVLLSPLAVGTTSLTVGNEDVGFASFPISIHPSTADCIAYDDAANPSYLDGFTLAPDPIGIRGFDPWRILEQTTAAGDVNGAKITTTIPTTGAISAILENNRTFSAYAYGPSATSTFSLYRPFGQPLAPGQEFTMDIGTHYRDGAKNFTLVNDCNNAQYPRFSFFIAGDAYGVDIHGLTNADRKSVV